MARQIGEASTETLVPAHNVTQNLASTRLLNQIEQQIQLALSSQVPSSRSTEWLLRHCLNFLDKRIYNRAGSTLTKCISGCYGHYYRVSLTKLVRLDQVPQRDRAHRLASTTAGSVLNWHTLAVLDEDLVACDWTASMIRCSP